MRRRVAGRRGGACRPSERKILALVARKVLEMGSAQNVDQRAGYGADHDPDDEAVALMANDLRRGPVLLVAEEEYLCILREFVRKRHGALLLYSPGP